MNKPSSTDRRKDDHIQICTKEDIKSRVDAKFDQISLPHCALPECDLHSIDLTTEFIGKKLSSPLFISCMTGGTRQAERINLCLAGAAEKAGIAMGLGSMRVLLEKIQRQESYKDCLTTFQLKKRFPRLTLFANIGAVQLNYEVTIEQCQQIVDLVEADALVLHLNPLQEALQPEGNHNWKGLFRKIFQLRQKISVPLIIKEVGFGISKEIAQKLYEGGITLIDVAGSGGTSWSRIEMFRAMTPQQRDVAAAFDQWGISTVDSILAIRSISREITILASGAIRTGIDGAKAIHLGAHMFGMAAPFLHAAQESEESVLSKIAIVHEQLRIAQFCSGAHRRDE